MVQLNLLLLLVLTSFEVFSKTPSPPKAAEVNPNEQIIELSITELGYQPSIVNADPDKLVTLKVTRKTNALCAKSLVILTQKIHRKLPLNQPVLIKLGQIEPGEIKLGCNPEIKESGLIYVK